MKRFPTLPSDCSSVRHVPARGEAGREACDSVAVSMIADVRLPAARRIHPEGMKDGSRGLSAAIPPVPGRKRPLPGRVPEPPISGSGTRSGVQAGAPLSGGLRFAATPGYRLATLRVAGKRRQAGHTTSPFASGETAPEVAKPLEPFLPGPNCRECSGIINQSHNH